MAALEGFLVFFLAVEEIEPADAVGAGAAAVVVLALLVEEAGFFLGLVAVDEAGAAATPAGFFFDAEDEADAVFGGCAPPLGA